MRERVEETITELDTKDMWITTFHSCVSYTKKRNK